MDREKVMSWLEGLAEPDWRDFHSDSEVQNIAKSALELLKAQRETIDELISADKALKLLKEQDYRSWLMNMFHKYGRDDLIALLVLYGEENLIADMLKEQETQKFFVDESGKITPLPVVVRCKDCKNLGYTNSHWFCKWLNRCVDEDWFCADGERRTYDV